MNEQKLNKYLHVLLLFLTPFFSFLVEQKTIKNKQEKKPFHKNNNDA